MRVQRHEFPDGTTICAEFPSVEIRDKFPLIIMDPPYGGIISEKWDHEPFLAGQLLQWANDLARISLPGATWYCWGGIGTPKNRPFFRFLSRVEEVTPWKMANLITWGKKRAYGVSNNYLFTREECAFFVLGDPKKPAVFNIPLLEVKRGYAGYNKKFPAKSEYLRRTNVWSDLTEMFSGKIHATQKPESVYRVLIQTSSNPGDTVFDPMAGSMTTAIAAMSLGRKFLCIERDEETYRLGVERIESKLRGDEGV